jgi:hypothetical protein
MKDRILQILAEWNMNFGSDKPITFYYPNNKRPGWTTAPGFDTAQLTPSSNHDVVDQ